MFLGKKILAIVPARGGSKGIPKKNLRKWNGLSLVGHVGRFCKGCKWIDACCISTDDWKIGNEGKKHGLEFIFRRPRILSGDKVPSEAAWRHAWSTYERKTERFFDVSLLLEPTSPERQIKDIKKTLGQLIKNNFNVVMTVEKVPLKYSAYKQMRIEDIYGKLLLSSGKKISRRQQLEKTYIKNGSAYAVNRSFLENRTHLLESKKIGLVTTDQRVNIDTISDLKK